MINTDARAHDSDRARPGPRHRARARPRDGHRHRPDFERESRRFTLTEETLSVNLSERTLSANLRQVHRKDIFSAHVDRRGASSC